VPLGSRGADTTRGLCGRVHFVSYEGGGRIRLVRSDRRLWSARFVYTVLLLVVAIIAPKLLVAVVVLFVSLWAASAPKWLAQIGRRMRR
jgi:hypothetical protein